LIDQTKPWKNLKHAIIISKIMRKTLGLILLVLLSCSKEESESLKCVPITFSDSYQYPVKPGTEEWIALGSREARGQSCMIPQEILKTISTGGLFESLLSYPFIIDYGAWEKFQLGFEYLKNENKGFAELYGREDLYQIIFNWYSSMSVECKEWIYRPFNAPVGVELEIIEMFIFQNEFLDSLNHDREIDIFKLIFDKLQSKISNGSVEGEELVSTAILGKIMFRSGFSPFVNECNTEDFIRFYIEFIPFYRPVDLSPTEIIEKYAKDFYKTL
jgi:hypothetical protein